jgi:hypothetical protein
MPEVESLSVDAVTRIVREAARATSPALQVVGITLGGGAASDYFEILVNISGCRKAPCQIEIGAFRDVPEGTLLSEVESKLRAHLASHDASA